MPREINRVGLRIWYPLELSDIRLVVVVTDENNNAQTTNQAF